MADVFHTGTVHLTAIRPEIWAASFEQTLKEALPFNDLIARDYQGTISALGDIVNISLFPQFAAATVMANEDDHQDAAAITVSTVQLNINKMIVQDFVVTDKAKIQTLEHANMLKDLAFFSIMKEMQAQIIAIIAPAVANAISYDVGTTLALADLLEAKELLDTGLVPLEGRKLVLDMPQLNDLWGITGFLSRDYIPTGSPLTTGQMPQTILGSELRATTEASAVTYNFHPSFAQVAVQKALGVEVFNLGVTGYRGVRTNCSLLMGTVQVYDDRVVSIS